MKTTKYILASAVLVSILLFSACGGGKKDSAGAKSPEASLQERVDEYIGSLTATDTTQVVELCSTFLENMKENRFDEAVGGIYEVDSLGQVSPLGEEMKESLRRRTRLFPVVSYSFEKMSFFLPEENTVTYKVAFNQATPPATMGWGFRPVKIDGKWYLTLLQATKN